MKGKAQTHRLRKIALGLTVVAIAAPSAQAYYFAEPGTANNVPSTEPGSWTIVPSKMFPTLEELRQLTSTPGDVTHPFSFTPSNEPGSPTVVTPDPTRGLPTIDELEQFRFTPESQAPAVAVEAPGGIDWTDAGIGAGIGIASLLLAAAAATGVRRRRDLAHS